MWGRVISLVIKELRAIWSDKRIRAVLIAPPVMETLIFGYAATFDVHNIDFAVLNKDMGLASRELVARFSGSPDFHVIEQLTDERQIQAVVDSRTALMVLHIGPEFSRDLRGGRQAKVQVIVDGRRSNMALVILNYAGTIIDSFNDEWASRVGATDPPARLVVRSWYNENLISRWQIIPGLVGLMTLVVTMLITALSVARERELGTFEQLLVTPLRPFEILLGKTIPAIIIGMVEGTIITLVAIFWFEVPLRGELFYLYIGLFVFVVSVIGFGLVISSISMTQQQAMLGTFLFLTPSILLSGFATPVQNMAEWVQILSAATPMRYFVEITQGVFLRDMDWLQLWGSLWPMIVIGVLTMMPAAWLFRHRMQ